MDTKKEAVEMQVLMCSLVPAEHPQMPGQPWYKVLAFDGSLEGMEKTAKEFDGMYQILYG